MTKHEQTDVIAWVFSHACRALGSQAEAHEFMITPHPELEGRTPIEVAETDGGTLRVEKILNALEHGLAL
ncbi:MAG: DUF2384 domain-containing protein [Hyphomicrobiales bacterium]|nr:DUF2384 domain-containing protein [Hyphomicrobiales bacterium]